MRALRSFCMTGGIRSIHNSRAHVYLTEIIVDLNRHFTCLVRVHRPAFPIQTLYNEAWANVQKYSLRYNNHTANRRACMVYKYMYNSARTHVTSLKTFTYHVIRLSMIYIE